MKPYVMTITGPSCAGKSTLEKMLVERGFNNAISTTSREPRAFDVEGENYYFISKSEFIRLDTQGAFVESVEFNGNVYALSVKEVIRLANLGKKIVVVCEPNGREQIRQYCNAQDWHFQATYVGNPPEVIAERFLRRFFEHGYDLSVVEGGSIQSIVPTYASRLVEMAATEFEWVAEAQYQRVDEGIEPYDFIIDEFNESNSESIAGIIASFAERLHKGENALYFAPVALAA